MNKDPLIYVGHIMDLDLLWETVGSDIPILKKAIIDLQ